MTLRQPLHHHRPHYFARHLKLGLEELYVMVGLNDLAASAILLFEPIYLLGLGFSFAQIALFFAVVYLLYALLVPLGGQIAARLGYPRTILLSSVALVTYYGTLFATAANPALVWVAALAYAVQKTLYWPTLEADFIRYADRDQNGRELSGIISLSTIVTVIGPLLGGLLVKLWGFPALFGAATALVLLSNIPLFFSQNPPSHEPVGYGQSWRRLVDRRHRRATTAYFGFAEELVVLVFWPIAMFLVVKSAAGLGAVASGATLATALVTLYIGKLVDRHRQGFLLHLGSTVTSLTWLARLAPLTAGLVVLLDTLSRTAKTIFYTPLLDLTFGRARREGPLKTTVFFEQALAVGKCLTAFLLVGIFSVTPDLRLAFVLAAAAALLYRRLAPAR